MQAPSLEHLMDMQASIEAGFQTYLTANGVTAYGSRYTGDIADKHILIAYTHGSGEGHCATSTTTNTGQKENDWFNGEINFLIATERSLAEASPVGGFASSHDYRVAQVKALMLRGSLAGTIAGRTALELDYHGVNVLSQAAEQQRIEDEAFDVTELSYSIQTQIKAESWPS